MQTANLKGVTIDGCPACGGLLLDSGELTALTGLEEKRPEGAQSSPSSSSSSSSVASAAASLPEQGGDLGRVYVPARQALAGFVENSRSFHLLQAKSEVGGAILGVAVNQPFQWTIENGLTFASIGPDDESTGRQLLAFVTGNMVASRFLLSDGRDNPMLVLARKTVALVSARLDVLLAGDEKPIGSIKKSVVGFSLDINDARGDCVLRFEKHASRGDVWGFTVVDKRGAVVGSVSRGFGNIEADVSILGGFGVERSVRRDDFSLDFEDVDVPAEHKGLALAALFLVAHTTNGPAGVTALFDG